MMLKTHFYIYTFHVEHFSVDSDKPIISNYSNYIDCINLTVLYSFRTLI